jgi:alpha-ketoglutarate-dependent taurine dioxygenase
MSEIHNLASQTEAPEILPFIGMKPGPRVAIRTEAARLDALQFDRIKVEPIGPTLGAEITGVDLANVDDAEFEEIRCAWLHYKVVFFRDQKITARQQMAFAQRFGELEEHPFLDASEDHEQIVRFEKGEDVSGFENIWHSDVSWRERPALASVLRSIEVPRHAGDTLFADMVTAYEGLDDDMKSRIGSLRAVHDFTHSFGHAFDADALAQKQKEFPAVSHPVVRTHPDTGRKILYVNSVFVSHIEGLDANESAVLLETLCRQATIPEYQCRFRWDRGAVAIWDNRSTQHYAASDYWPKPRVMERVAITGDRPT